MRNKKGFTLIEMLVVIAVIGILSAAVLAALGPARNKAKAARVISALNQVRAVAEVLYDGTYPAGAMDLDGSGDDPSLTDLAADVTGNQGTLVITVSGDGLSYAAHSNLPGDTFYCVDSVGSAGKAATDPGSATVCP